MQYKSITFIGGGNMTQAIVFGLLKQGYPAEQITVCDRNLDKLALFQAHQVHVSQDNVVAANKSEVLILAVKPQSMSQTCQALSAVNFSQKLVISIAAAISLAKLTALLPTAQHIIRVMPNTPALVSAGMSGLFAPATLPVELKVFAERLMNAVGESTWLTAEEDMHAITAGSGSSPAYFFLFMEAMQQALVNLNLSPETARLLIQQSAFGAAKMVMENPQIALSQLRENVTSKGGTTAAALAVFNQHKLDEIVQQAVNACVQRSKEMEKLL